MTDLTTPLSGALRSVQTILSCGVQTTTELADFFKRFESAHCFDPAIQPGLSAQYLDRLAKGLSAGEVCEAEKPLGTLVTFFWLDDSVVVSGPYTSHSTLEAEDAEKLDLLGVARSHLSAYRIYRASFPIVDSEYVMRAAAALLQEGSRHGPVRFRRSAYSATYARAEPYEVALSESYEATRMRYNAEQDFVRAVARGDEARALSNLSKLGSRMDRLEYLSIPYLAPTMLRLLCRVAAQQGGLSPIAIDAVSQSYAQRLHRVGLSRGVSMPTTDAVEMVVDFCRLVRKHRQGPYSSLVRKVISEIEVGLSSPVSPKALAAGLKVSAAHMSRKFKAETGMTISEYVARERVTLAQQLLRDTDRSVQDIAAEVGYFDANYFIKVFRSTAGTTPSAYRRDRR